MILHRPLRTLLQRVSSLAFACTLSLFTASVHGQSSYDPGTSETFGQATAGMTLASNYTFGTGSGRTVQSLQQLAANFDPYGIAGTIVINNEWERYQPFNSLNFVFTNSSLNLTATLPANGGLFSGGINSGQIWTKKTYQPGLTGAKIYAFEVRMRIPDGPGMWPAAWFYTKQPGINDTSEIDNPEFFDMEWQNMMDWTGFQHGPGQGSDIYSLKTNQYVWHPGLIFSADYHDYQTLWTPDAVYKYVDGTLIYAQSFKWTSRGPAQLGVNLAVGSPNLPGLLPTSVSEFPAALSIDHIMIWSK